MTIKLPASVVAFASGQTKLYENFVDYWNHYRALNGDSHCSYREVDDQGNKISFAQKEDAVGKLFVKEIGAKANIDVTSMSAEQLCTHPVLSWAAVNIASQLIDAVLPDTLITSTSAYAEIKQIGLGETAVFDIRPRDLFPVTKAGRLGMREAEMHKGFDVQRTINPVDHMITVGVSLYRVLNGSENLASFTVKALRSIETEMTKDIYTAFATGMAALSTDATTGLQVTGYTQADLTKLAQKVESFSGGSKAIVVGTKVALANILPSDTNVRADIASDYVKLGYVRTIAGIDTFELPQVADWTNPFSVYLSDSSLWVIAPGTDKIVKCVIGGSIISNVTGQFDSSLLMQNATFHKFWAAGVATSSVGGLITL